jgi:hypothetical protein
MPPTPDPLKARRRLRLALAALFVLSIATLWLFFRNAQANTVKFEIARAVLQLGVVSVIGAVVSSFTFDYQQARQSEDRTKELYRKNLEYREELLKSTLAKTVSVYADVKKARRLMRARALSHEGHPEIVVLAAPYDSYMGVINDEQLEIENIAGDIETSLPAFTNPKLLMDNLEFMEKYLGDLISEYEKLRPTFRGTDPLKNLSEMPALDEFLNFLGRARDGATTDSKFKKQFVIPFREIKKGIRSDLLHPQFVDPFQHEPRRETPGSN